MHFILQSENMSRPESRIRDRQRRSGVERTPHLRYASERTYQKNNLFKNTQRLIIFRNIILFKY